jgi:SAM-dependent methyltransferase
MSRERLDGPRPADVSSRAADWDRAYARDRAPWDIGRPQPAIVGLADAGEIASPVLDAGCGTGEHALLLAARGMEAVGVDLSPTAVARAREKARTRGLDADFMVGDVLALDRLERRFATVIDSGTFHVFDDPDRARYVRSLASALEPGGVLHLLCFSEETPGTEGPRRVTQAELRASFADGWKVTRIEATRFDVRGDWLADRPHAWLATMVRARSRVRRRPVHRRTDG